MNTAPNIAPADGRPRKSWPLWGKILAYLLLIALASLSIWFVDRDAVRATYFWDAGSGLAK